MKPLYESILKSTNSGIYAIGETIYNKLLNGEKLTVRELKWINTNVGVFKVNREQLINLINKLKMHNISLNWLDVSNITNMNDMFAHLDFNGDISKWDVRKVSDMSYMFYKSKFNGNISKWDVRNVINMRSMFAYSEFNMDISNWEIHPKSVTYDMFFRCPIEAKYKPKKL